MSHDTLRVRLLAFLFLIPLALYAWSAVQAFRVDSTLRDEQFMRDWSASVRNDPDTAGAIPRHLFRPAYGVEGHLHQFAEDAEAIRRDHPWLALRGWLAAIGKLCALASALVAAVLLARLEYDGRRSMRSQAYLLGHLAPAWRRLGRLVPLHAGLLVAALASQLLYEALWSYSHWHSHGFVALLFSLPLWLLFLGGLLMLRRLRGELLPLKEPVLHLLGRDLDLALQMAADVGIEAGEDDLRIAGVLAADVGLQQGQQLAAEDLLEVAVDPRQPLAGLGLAADQGEQADEAFQLVQAIAMFEETHAARRMAPALLGADRFEQRAGQLDDEFLAVRRIGQVDRIVRVDQQQLARRQGVFLPAAAPQAVAAQEDLQVEDALQRRRGDPYRRAVADPAQVEAGEGAVVEAGLRPAGGRQAYAVRTDVPVDIAGHRIGVGTFEHPAALAEQGGIHGQDTQAAIVVVIAARRQAPGAERPPTLRKPSAGDNPGRQSRAVIERNPSNGQRKRAARVSPAGPLARPLQPAAGVSSRGPASRPWVQR